MGKTKSSVPRCAPRILLIILTVQKHGCVNMDACPDGESIYVFYRAKLPRPYIKLAVLIEMVIKGKGSSYLQALH
jgi:hypothetical protein